MSNLSNKALLNTYIQTKRMERELKEKRVELEKQILEVYGDNVPEDKIAKSFREDNFKITIKRNISYKLQEQGWDIISQMPEAERPIKISLDETKAKKMVCLEDYLTIHETKPTIEVVIE